MMARKIRFDSRMKTKLKIDDKKFQGLILKNPAAFAARKSALNGLRLELQRELKAKFKQQPMRMLKKRGVVDIATQDIEALYREASTGRGAAAVKKRGGRISDRGGA